MPESSAIVPPCPARPLILLIEDDEWMRELLAEILDLEGFRTLGINSGDEVLTTPRETLMEAACGLVDDSLSGNISGMQTVVILHLINPKIRVFPIPGRPLTECEKELIAQHHQEILFKPFAIPEMLEAIKNATS